MIEQAKRPGLRVPKSTSAGLLRGPHLANQFGYIVLPLDVVKAFQGADATDVVEIKKSGSERLYINKPALRDVLLNVRGVEIFTIMINAVQRAVVLTRVANMPIPFCAMIEPGKTLEWKPFFGWTEYSLISGEGTSAGQHTGLIRVQIILNTNLIISAADLIDNNSSGEEEHEYVPPEIAKHIQYQTASRNEYYKQNGEEAFMRRMTGYDPCHVHPPRAKKPWVESILVRLSATQ